MAGPLSGLQEGVVGGHHVCSLSICRYIDTSMGLRTNAGIYQVAYFRAASRTLVRESPSFSW